jgi:hypothetical protein
MTQFRIQHNPEFLFVLYHWKLPVIGLKVPLTTGIHLHQITGSISPSYSDEEYPSLLNEVEEESHINAAAQN